MTAPTGCPECGAMIGHRVVDEPCPLGGDDVPRAEHERVKRERDEARDAIEDWQHIAVLQRRNAGLYLDNLTSVQARCTELLEEVRALKQVASYEGDDPLHCAKCGVELSCGACEPPYCGAV